MAAFHGLSSPTLSTSASGGLLGATPPTTASAHHSLAGTTSPIGHSRHSSFGTEVTTRARPKTLTDGEIDRHHQKWIDVETRMLANWQEFVKHRQDVSVQLHEIRDSLRTATSEASKPYARCETEVARCSARIQQLGQAGDDLASSMSRRLDALQSSVDKSQESICESVSKKLLEVTAAVDGQQREVADKVLEAAKRTNRTVAEDLLRKMEELNGKLGENMESLEEQSAWSLQRVQQDVKDLAAKVDDATYIAEAEVHKLEARLESTWRQRLGEVEAQLHEVSDRTLRSGRDSGGSAEKMAMLEARLQEYSKLTETGDVAVKQLHSRLDWSSTRLEEVQALNLEQIGRAREDMFALVHEQQKALRKALDSHLDDSDGHVRQLRTDVSTYIDDACSRSDVRDMQSELQSQINSLQANVSQQTSSVSEHSRHLCAEACQQSRAWVDDALSQSAELVSEVRERINEVCEHVDAAVAELRQADEMHRKDVSQQHEAVERQQTEIGAQVLEGLRKLQEQCDALRHAEQDLSEAQKSLKQEVAEFKEQSAEQHQKDNKVLHPLANDIRELQEASHAAAERVAGSREDLSRKFGAELTELRAQTRGLCESFASQQTQAADSQQRLDGRLVQMIRDVNQEVAESHASSRANTDQHASAINRLQESLARQSDKASEQVVQAQSTLTELVRQTRDSVSEATSHLQHVCNANQDQLARVKEKYDSQSHDVDLVQKRLEVEFRESRQSSEKQLQELHQQLGARCAESDAHLQSLRLEVSGHAKQQADDTAGAMANIAAQTRSLGENLASQQIQGAESQQRLEGRLAQMIRDVAEEVIATKAQQGSALSGLQESLARHSDKASVELAEAKSGLGELVRQARESMTDLQQVCDSNQEHLVCVKEQLRDAEVVQKRFEVNLNETKQINTGQIQEIHQQLSVRRAECDSKLESLRMDISGQIKRQSDESVSTLGRLQTLDQRVSQEKERIDVAVDAQCRQIDKRIESVAARFSTSLAEHENQLKRTFDTCQEASSKAAEDLRNVVHSFEDQVKSRHDGVVDKTSTLQSQISELKALGIAASASSQQREEQMNAEFDRRARAAKDEANRLEARMADVSSTSTRVTEVAEQRLRTQLESTMASVTAKLQAVQVETEQLRSKSEEGSRSSETKHGEFSVRLDELRDQAQSLQEDVERRSTRHVEALELLKRQTVEQAEALRKKTADVQQGAEQSLQQRSAEITAQGKAALFEASQKLARDTATSLTDLRVRIDEVTERLGSELREAQAGLSTKLTEVQGEFRGQLTSERQTSQSLATEHARQQDDRLREVQAMAERDRTRSEVQATKQLEEAQRGFKRELTEACQKVEAAHVAALERDVGELQRSVEDVRRSALTATRDQGENVERRFREQADSATKANTELGDQLGSLESEQRSLQAQLQVKAQGHEEHCDELKEQLVVLEKDLRQVAEELPAMARRWDSARHTQNAAVEELKRSSQECHSQLQRQVQSDGEALHQLKQQHGATQDDWKSRHREAEEALHSTVVGVQKQTQEDVALLHSELATLRDTHSKLAVAMRAGREKHGVALTELGRRTEEWFVQAQRRFDEVEVASSQSRIVTIVGEQAEGIIKTVTSHELQAFQREALDSVEWKLERCVQWLHGANVKLGLNPHGTMFSTDRFRAMLFDEARRPQTSTTAAPNTLPSTPRSRHRANSAQPLRKGAGRSP